MRAGAGERKTERARGRERAKDERERAKDERERERWRERERRGGTESVHMYADASMTRPYTIGWHTFFYGRYV